jgi:hypothetical protein
MDFKSDKWFELQNILNIQNLHLMQMTSLLLSFSILALIRDLDYFFTGMHARMYDVRMYDYPMDVL